MLLPLVLAGCSASLIVSPARGPQAAAAVQPRRALVACSAAAPPTGFVQTEMRGAAMKLHTRDQSREGEQKAQKPVSKWEPGRADYLRFLVDSREVYTTFEELVAQHDELGQYRSHGLERAAALDEDIAWFAEEGLETPAVGKKGTDYSALLREMVEAGRWEAFTCHFYNFYFAHTAGGRMIGKQMADKLLDGRTLQFYQWGGAEPKEELLPSLRDKIDAVAETWTREQKDACLEQTAASFRYGGGMLAYLRAPQE